MTLFPPLNKKVYAFLVKLDKRIEIPHENLRDATNHFCQQRQPDRQKLNFA